MKTMERDVIVVGAGPGGSTCSAFLLRQGLDVLMLDKEVFPRDKPCGDGQVGVATRTLAELGWLEEYKETLGYENYGIVITSPDYTKLVVNAPFKGMRYDAPRRLFDHYCVKCAVKEGVEFKENAWVYDVIWENGKVCGVKAKVDGEYVEIRSKMVIGADGSHSVIAKKLGLFPDTDNGVAVGGRCYIEDVEMEAYNEIHFDKHTLPGYIWLFPERNKICNVGIGFNRDMYLETRKPMDDLLFEWIERSPFGERLRGKRMVGEFRGWRLPSGSQSMEDVAPGCILIGDAGSMIMPLTGEGVGPAMVTGKMAAELCREAIDTNNFSMEMMLRYTKRRDKMYNPKYESIKKIEKAFESEAAVNHFVHQLVEQPQALEMFTQQWYFEAYEAKSADEIK